MNIKILPLPKGGRNRAGAGVFSSIGKFSRPFLKQILRIGLNKLKEKAMDKIKRGGENLTRLATMQQQQQQQLKPIESKEGGYKPPDAPTSFIHSPLAFQKGSILRKKRKKSAKKKKSKKIGGKRRLQKAKGKVKRKKIGGKVKRKKAGGKAKGRKKRRFTSVFDRL